MKPPTETATPPASVVPRELAFAATVTSGAGKGPVLELDGRPFQLKSDAGTWTGKTKQTVGAAVQIGFIIKGLLRTAWSTSA